MQPIKLTPMQAFWRSLVLILQAAQLEIFPLVLMTLISGVSPSLSLFFNKLIIDEVAKLLILPLSSLWEQPLLLWIIGGLITLNLVSDAIRIISNFITATLRDRVQGFANAKILEKIANFPDLNLFESPELLNLIKLTDKGTKRIEELSFILITSLSGFAIFIPAIIFSSTITWWIPLVLVISSFPSIYVELKYREKSWMVEKTQANLSRQMDLYKTMLSSHIYAKEIRLFDLQYLLLTRWNNFFVQTFNAMRNVRKKGTVLIIFWSLISGMGVVVPYYYIILGTLEKHYTLGDLALYAGLILQIRQSLFILINNSTNLYDVILATIPIFQVLDLQPQLQQLVSKTISSYRHIELGIEINNLSFSYREDLEPIFENINLTIKPGEIIALVGENGAGKTTLIKLLCRFYDPNQGAIFWNGQDLRELTWKELHSRLAVIMQDYAKFPTSLRENIAFGNLDLFNEDKTIIKTLQKIGMGEELKDFPQGLDTLLGRELEGGIELSGGQWQRIAIARSLLRLSSAELLIFDEPTAAIDAKAEDEIYQIFRTLTANKMTVVISHRLSLCKLADRIVVLKNNRITEIGNHNQLMQKQGEYYQMFSRQASRYL